MNLTESSDGTADENVRVSNRAWNLSIRRCSDFCNFASSSRPRMSYTWFFSISFSCSSRLAVEPNLLLERELQPDLAVAS